MNLKLIFLIITLLSSSALTLYGANSKVVKLTQDNFKEKVTNSKEPWIVEFYAPWCGHCKSMAPAFEKAAMALGGMVNLGAVDMTTDQQVGAPYNVQGFPTIKLFGVNKNSPKDHNGGRGEKEFVSAGVDLVREIANNRLGGGSSGGQQQKSSGSGSGSGSGSAGPAGDGAIALTASNFKVKGNGLWFIMFMAPWCGHCKAAKPDWNKAANALKGMVNVGIVDCTTEQSLCAGVQGYPTFFWYDENGKKNPYEGGRDYAAFTNHGRKISGKDELADANVRDLPFVQLTSQKIFDDYCTKVKSSICILALLPHILDVSVEERAAQLTMLGEAKKKMAGKPFNFMWSQGGDQFDWEDSMNLGMGYPSIVTIVAGKKKFSTMRRSWGKDNLVMYLNGLAAGGEHFYDIKELPTKLKTIEAYVAKKADKTETDL